MSREEVNFLQAPTSLLIFPAVSRIYVDQLKDEGPPGYNASPTGQQVPAHQALQHRALSTALEARRQYKHSLIWKHIQPAGVFALRNRPAFRQLGLI